jgi:N-succinyldiaminopimelate aminotransferase
MRLATRLEKLVRTNVYTEFRELAEKHDAVNLVQGSPDFDGPEEMKEAALAAIRAGDNQYSVTKGTVPLREAIARHAARFYGMDVDPETMVSVTAGAGEALYAAILGLVNPGDEVIYFEPGFEFYPAMIELAHGTGRPLPLHAPDERHPSWWFSTEELTAAFTARTRMIVVNTPSNPTGKVFSHDELSLIARLCREHDVVAVCDEVYEHLVYPPARHIRLATLPDMAERTITMSSASKTFSATGWRVGWAIARPALLPAVQQPHQYLSFCAPTPFQAAVVVALDLGDEWYAEFARSYMRRRDRLVEVTEGVGLRTFVPEGAAFVLADVTSLGFEDDYDFCRHLATEIKVAALPVSPLYAPGSPSKLTRYARFAFCKSDRHIDAAASRLRSLRARS